MSAPGPNATGAGTPNASCQTETEVDNGAHLRRSPGQVVKDIVLFFAAPFITLAYLPLFPFLGMAMMSRAWRHRHEVR